MIRVIGLLIPVSALLLVSCGKEDFKRTTRRGVDDPMAANLKDVGKPSADRFEELAPREGSARKKPAKKKSRSSSETPVSKPDEFTERDFIESEQESRDPFRNLQMKEAAQAPAEAIVAGDVVYLQEYGVAELKVTGIVGSHRRTAMVLDPRTGRTTILHRRDRIGKESAVIFEINRDHLVLLVPKEKPDPDDPYERKTIYVDEQRRIVDIGTDALRPDESGIRYSSGRGRPSGRGPAKEP